MDFFETKSEGTADTECPADLSPLHRGSMFIKLTAGGDPLERTYFLSEDNRFLRWNSNFWAFKSLENRQIDVHSIKRIQKGQLSAKFERWKPILQVAASRSFSIIYGEDSRCLDLIADSEEELDIWYKGLRRVKREAAAGTGSMDAEEHYLQSNFETASSKSSSPSKSMDLSDLHSTLHRMNHPISDRALDSVVRRVCGDLDKDITRKDFDRIVQALRRRFDLEHLWKMLVAKSFDEELSHSCQKFGIAKMAKKDTLSASESSVQAETITENDFQEFWSLFQGSSHGEDDVSLLIMEALPMSVGEPSDGPLELSYEHFHRIMTSPANDAYNPKAKQKLPSKFLEPLSDYFIASSHNTYLAGDQLTGSASVDRFLDVLEKGCRCVELQVWDGEQDSCSSCMPIVSHGTSFAKAIAFDEVIRIIKECAFSMNTRGESNDMPVIISLKNNCCWDQQKILADVLKTELGDLLERAPSSDSLLPLPSPLEMKRKILVKGRKIEGKTNSELYKLFYFSTVHSTDFMDERRRPTTVVSSCDDAEAARWLGEPKLSTAWMEHNMSHLSRVYSAGSRIRSSNMNPVGPWSVGAQMVALNYQSDGIPMFLNHGKFLENQGCGYVLKPPYMRSADEYPMAARSISVHVIGGNLLPRAGSDMLSPCVLVNMCGLGTDNVEFKTKTVDNNGFNPVWDEVFTFTVLNPENAQLLFRVINPSLAGRDDFVAFSSIPVVNLMQGFRNVILYDKNGTRDGDVAYASLSIRTTSAAL